MAAVLDGLTFKRELARLPRGNGAVQLRTALNRLDDAPQVAQAAAALWIPEIARAESCLNTGGHVCDDGAALRRSYLRSDGPRRMTEAIAHKDIIVRRVLLVHAFAQLIFAESLLVVDAVVDHRACCRGAESILNVAHFLERHREQRLERDAVDAFASRTA